MRLSPLILRWVCCAIIFALPGRGRAEDLFSRGSELYQAGQFSDAAQTYRAALSNEVTAGTLVNLGMVEWRRGRSGAAVQAWEQALWLDAGEEHARNNLRYAREVAGVEAPQLTWYETASTWLPTNSWAWLTGLGLWLALGFVTLPGILRWRRAGWHQVVAALGLGIFLLSIPAHLGTVTRARIGFVLGKKTPLRLTPTEESDVLVTLASGEPARLVRRRGDFVFIRTATAAGWVARPDFGLLCPD